MDSSLSMNKHNSKTELVWEKKVAIHLQNVYTTMGICLLVCAAGSYVHVVSGFFQPGLWTAGGAFIAIFLLAAMSPTVENRPIRFQLLMIIAFLNGLILGPLLQQVIEIDPSIILTAFLLTAVIFLCFSMSALFSDDPQWIPLGGILSSALSWLVIAGLLNIFFQSEIIFEAELYIGLALFCGFILYDTQMIVERLRQGDDDYISNSLNLFLDFLNIFVRIVIILTKKKEEKRNKRKRN